MGGLRTSPSTGVVWLLKEATEKPEPQIPSLEIMPHSSTGRQVSQSSNMSALGQLCLILLKFNAFLETKKKESNRGIILVVSRTFGLHLRIECLESRWCWGNPTIVHNINLGLQRLMNTPVVTIPLIKLGCATLNQEPLSRKPVATSDQHTIVGFHRHESRWWSPGMSE